VKARWKKYRAYFITSLALALVFFYFALPDPLFSDSYSTVLQDREGHLLSAAISTDGQWRFPEQKKVSDKFGQALKRFEDKRFDDHIGVDFLSLARATRQNIQAGKIVSGGSTLSMQVIRLARKNQPRSFFEKVIEMILAIRLELRYSKDEILSFYASHAPFGGNVVGMEAACLRYFGRSSSELSWAEAAMLAVLPNNPSLIHLGKNRNQLKQKRDRLLQRLFQEGFFDAMTLELALAEPIPAQPTPLPRLAPHLLDRVSKEGYAQQTITTTIDYAQQLRTNQILHDHYNRLQANQIFNAAALIIDVKTGAVIAYVGNVHSGYQNQEQVDVIAAPRSTGSILKPFLFAALLDDGKMLSKTLQPDIPILINGFAPKNFSNEFDGAVPADQALIRSLNVPAVEELRNYRYEKFYELLKNMGLTTLVQPPDHYGLSLILGGAEGTLWDITGMYASMARTLNNYFEHPGKNRYIKSDFHPPHYLFPDSVAAAPLDATSWLSASSIYLTFDALQELYRPGEETGWKYFSNTKKIAWKTGTSHGFRDGWAVGVNGDYAVGVWVGNADGEGRPGLTGTEAAAPILFDLFSSVPEGKWFAEPTSEMTKIPVCSKSGYRFTDVCEKADTIWVTQAGLQTAACPFHQKIHLSPDQKFRVHAECEDPMKMISRSQFVLPPVKAYYFKQKNPGYASLPPFRSDCANPSTTHASMDLIYPKPDAKIYIPIELTGAPNYTVFEAAHQSPTATLFWHIDHVFVGSTTKNHQISLIPAAGKHILTIVDNTGESISRSFSVLSSNKK
jgi:penicillin-binding protein 1C